MKERLVKFHSKHKGVLGEVAVIKNLLKSGYSVFTEVGDLSRTDLIVLVDKIPIKLQVKSGFAVKGVIDVPASKSGPGYKYKYQTSDVDVFACYIIDQDLVFYISAKEHLKNTTSTKFRINKPLNNQKSGVRFATDYLDFKNVLRDYTPGILNLKDDDIVQTTTETSG